MANRKLWLAAASRLEKIYKTLTSDTCGAATVTVNHAAANAAIQYCRDVAADGDEDEDDPRWTELLQFVGAHNQSLDWIFGDDPVSMILRLAAGTSSVTKPELRLVSSQ